MTPTEVKEFLERMPSRRTFAEQMPGFNSPEIEALDVIDFLVAEKSTIRREAFLEAAKVTCRHCEAGIELALDGTAHKIADGYYVPCPGDPIRKLAEQPEVKS